jgi:hypothetical protein
LYNEWQKDEVIASFTDNLGGTTFFVAKKMILYLGWFDWKFEMTYNQNPKNYSNAVRSCVAFGWGQYVFILLCALIGYSSWCKKNPLSIFQITYIGITLVYIFIEAFSSYRYESYPLLMIFAGIGFEKLVCNSRCHNLR